MRPPIRKLRKSDIVWLAEHRCKAHSHDFLSHYDCFLREKPDTSPVVEKIGIFDIESTGLKSNWSHMLAWCIKDHNEDTIYEDLITRREARDKNDKRIVNSLVKKMRGYDRLITWYGTGHDLPYTRSRAIHHGLDFPAWKTLYHTDLYYVARAKLSLHSNRLQAVCQWFDIEAKVHPMTPDLWEKAGAGDKEALETILQHCREDVISTDNVFNRLLEHCQLQKRSV